MSPAYRSPQPSRLENEPARPRARSLAGAREIRSRLQTSAGDQPVTPTAVLTARSALRAADTSADRGFRAGRHGGGAAAPYPHGSARPSSRIRVTNMLGLRSRWGHRRAPAQPSRFPPSFTPLVLASGLRGLRPHRLLRP